jgi:hypothetical protein
MSPSNRVEFDRNSGALDAEQTLRLVAMLPAPEGLEERVKANLHSAPDQAKVISWPLSADRAGWMHSAGIRAAAAAAIVLVVAGGGWEVYSHIRVAQVPSAVSAPPALNGSGSFSAAGAKRVPQTVEGPVIATPVVSKQKQGAAKAAATAKARTLRKSTAVPVESLR